MSVIDLAPLAPLAPPASPTLHAGVLNTVALPAPPPTSAPCAVPAPAAAGTPSGPLTDRELEVLTLMADGLTAVAIGRRLGIAPGTVRKHVEHLYDKLSCHDRLLAVTHARAVGLLPS